MQVVVRSMARFRLSSHNLRVELGRHNRVPYCARFCTRCAAVAAVVSGGGNIGPQGAPIDDEKHVLGVLQRTRYAWILVSQPCHSLTSVL